MMKGCRIQAYGNLKVNHLLRVCAHVVVEAELVLADLVGGEDKVALALLLALHDGLGAGASHIIVDIERAAGLNLRGQVVSKKSGSENANGYVPYSKVKGNLLGLVLGHGVEARFLVRSELVCQCCR